MPQFSVHFSDACDRELTVSFDTDVDSDELTFTLINSDAVPGRVYFTPKTKDFVSGFKKLMVLNPEADDA